MLATARGDRSTKTASPQPRLRASMPTPPVPANRSRNRQPGRRGPRMLNRLSFARSVIGRGSRVGGDRRMRRLAAPAMSRIRCSACAASCPVLLTSSYGGDHQTKEAKSGMDGAAADRLAIRELVENWAVWRDAGDWDRFRTVWHDDGRMMATWFQGPFADFIRVSQQGFDRGVRILHFLGGSSVELAGERAISQT